jgi:hypothetical protein
MRDSSVAHGDPYWVQREWGRDFELENACELLSVQDTNGVRSMNKALIGTVQSLWIVSF